MLLRAISIRWRVALLATVATAAVLATVGYLVERQNDRVDEVAAELERIERVDTWSRVQATNVFPEMAEVLRRLDVVGDGSGGTGFEAQMWNLTRSRFAAADDARRELGGDDEIAEVFEVQRRTAADLDEAVREGEVPTPAQIAAAERARRAADLAMADLAQELLTGAWVVHLGRMDAIRASWAEFALVAPSLAGIPVAEPRELALQAGIRAGATERVVVYLPQHLRGGVASVLDTEANRRWRAASEAAFDVASGAVEPWSPLALQLVAADAVTLASKIDDLANAAVDDVETGLRAEAASARRDRRQLLLFGLAYLLFVGALAGRILQSITDPLLALTRRAGAVAAGDLDRDPIEPGGRDELARLGTTIEEVATGLRHLDLQFRAITDGVLDDPSLDVAAPGAIGAAVHDRIDELRSTSGALRADAGTDALTGLPNRRGLLGALGSPPDRAVDPRLVVFVDLDRFKVVNDDHGHRHGDAVLQTVGNRLRGFLRDDDLVARLGGDEFVLVAAGIPQEAVDGLVARIEDHLSQPVVFEGIQHRVGCSLGVAWLDPGVDPAEAIDLADRRMLAVKSDRGSVR